MKIRVGVSILLGVAQRRNRVLCVACGIEAQTQHECNVRDLRLKLKRSGKGFGRAVVLLEFAEVDAEVDIVGGSGVLLERGVQIFWRDTLSADVGSRCETKNDGTQAAEGGERSRVHRQSFPGSTWLRQRHGPVCLECRRCSC